MERPKMLFVDDRSRRLRAAINQYGPGFDLTLAPSVSEALTALATTDFSVVSLDHDLNGDRFQDPDSAGCGMEILRYIEKTGWPKTRYTPEFWIHSYNAFAAQLMIGFLRQMGFKASVHTIKYPDYHTGVVAGAFDIIHPGYIRLFRDAKRICDYLIVALHKDPTIEHPHKLKPVMGIEDRAEILSAIRYVDEVVPYATEAELDLLLKQADIRVVGSDHRGVSTRPELDMPVFYHNRNHEWSSTRLKRMISESFYRNPEAQP